MDTATLKSDGRKLALMVTWAVMKTSESLIGGHMVKKRVAVTTDTGAPYVLRPGLIFKSESQAKDILKCDSEDILAGIKNGALQWRTPEAAQRLLNTPGYANNGPQVGFGNDPTPKGNDAGSYRDTSVDNLTVESGDNLSYNPAHLANQTIEWKKAELTRQRPQKNVEAMDDSMLNQVLSENYVG